MAAFSVSRLTTDKGIFRLSGDWQQDDVIGRLLVINRLAILGTDGWLPIDDICSSVNSIYCLGYWLIYSDKVIKLICLVAVCYSKKSKYTLTLTC